MFFLEESIKTIYRNQRDVTFHKKKKEGNKNIAFCLNKARNCSYSGVFVQIRHLSLIFTIMPSSRADDMYKKRILRVLIFGPLWQRSLRLAKFFSGPSRPLPKYNYWPKEENLSIILNIQTLVLVKIKKGMK